MTTPTMRELDPEVLKFWQDRERTLPPRLRRMVPDDMDMVSGTWARAVAEVRKGRLL